MTTAGFTVLVTALWLGLAAAFWTAIGWRLPTSCPRLIPIDGHGPYGTWPLPIGVAALQERLVLEKRCPQWWTDRNKLMS